MLILLLILAVITFICFKFYSKVRSLPPGPFPLPLIGSVHQLIFGLMRYKNIGILMRKWQEKHGDVFTMWLGPMAMVNICDYQTAQDAMVKKGAAFATRPKIFLMDIFREGRGIVVSNGDHWTEQRRFALHTLRNFGLGRKIMQDRIMLEFDYRKSALDKQIDANGGSMSFDPFHLVELTIGNIVNRMLFSERFTEEREEEFFKLKSTMDKMMENTNVFDLLLTERSAEWPLFKQRMDFLKGPIGDVIGFIGSQVEERKQDIANGKHELHGEGDDFVDAFLIHMQKEDHEDSFTDETLVITCMDLWAAGLETTSVTLHWMFAYLTLYPEVVEKLQSEIDKVTGRNRSLELSDKAKTPYLNAFILESMRVSSLAPLNLVRDTAEDTVVGGFLIPKGTNVAAQLSMIMFDPKKFEEPEKFKPERFLEQSDLDQFVVPFGLGKRACPGESLARAELYMVMGNLMLYYNVAADPEHPASLEAISELGGVRKPKHFQAKISRL